MNNGVDASFFLFAGFFMCLFLFGFMTGKMLYKHDTFDCTNSCDKKHSIYFDNACYCKAGE